MIYGYARVSTKKQLSGNSGSRSVSSLVIFMLNASEKMYVFWMKLLYTFLAADANTPCFRRE